MTKQATQVAELPLFEDYEESGLLTVVSGDEDDKEEEKKKEEEDKTEEKPEPDKVLKDDEKSKEDDVKEKDEEKADSDSDKDEESKDEDEDDEGDTIWDLANKITGSELEVDFGDTDPETPEGVAVWEEAVRKQQSDLTFNWIKDNFPKVARALNYEMNGGSIDDLYVPGEPDFSEVKIDENDAASQKRFLSQYYRWKDVSEEEANALIEIAEDKGNLAATANKALESRKKEQSGRMEKAQSDATMKETSLRQNDSKLSEGVSGLINKGHLNSFTVPQKERKEFTDFALSHMQRDGQGGHLIIIPVDPANLSDQAQMLYFGYKGGNLENIIQRAMETKQTRKFKSRAAKAEKETGESGSADLRKAAEKKKAGTDLPVMDDYTVD